MNFDNFDSLLNTTENMEVLRNNSKNDDGTDTIVGVNWFVFNSLTASNIYVNGNSFLGFGENIAHLKICNRDGAIHYLYRQEGMLFDFYKFLKIRIEGYSLYNSTNASYKLVYEVFLIDTGDIFLNVITLPNNSSYFGESSILSNGSSTSLDLVLGKPEYITLYHADKQGVSWNIAHEKIPIDPVIQKYLVRMDNLYYSYLNNGLEAVDVSELNGDAFINHGFNKPESFDFLKQYKNYEVFNWINTDLKDNQINFRYTAIPDDQILVTETFDIVHPSILGIQNIALDCDNVFFQFSFDDGKTYMIYRNGWIATIDEWMSKEEIALLTFDIFKTITFSSYMFRLKIIDAGYLKKITINYKNGE